MLDHLDKLGSFLGGLTAIVALPFAYQQLRAHSRQRRLDLGQFYITRYWNIDDELMEAEKGSPEHRRARHKYLRLFEDEFEAAQQGWLETEQWSVWHAYLDGAEAASRIREDLDAVRPDGSEFTLLRTCLSQRAREQQAHTVASCAVGRRAERSSPPPGFRINALKSDVEQRWRELTSRRQPTATSQAGYELIDQMDPDGLRR